MKNLILKSTVASFILLTMASPALAGSKTWAVGWTPTMSFPTDSLWFAAGVGGLVAIVVARMIRAARG
ncbi:MAG: hypothetical protein ABFS23_01760 [Pseudomonadota bacterium]